MKAPKILELFEVFWKTMRFPADVIGPSPEVKYFQSVLELEKTPVNATIGEHDFVIVNYETVYRWALFKCPCGCGAVVSLPLMAPHKPRWSVYVDEEGLPSLYPSVWRNIGCMSHFIIRAGSVFWAGKTGVSPFEASPKHYKPRPPE